MEPRFRHTVGISRLPGTPRQHTVEVCASPGPQQAGRTPINALSSVRPVDVQEGAPTLNQNRLRDKSIQVLQIFRAGGEGGGGGKISLA